MDPLIVPLRDLNKDLAAPQNGMETPKVVQSFEKTDQVIKKVCFSGKDAIFNQPGETHPFTATEGGRLQKEKHYVVTYLDVEGNKSPHPKLSAREPYNPKGYFPRAIEEGSIKLFLETHDLTPIPPKQIDTRFHEIILDVNDSSSEEAPFGNIKLLKDFAHGIIKNEESDYIDLGVALKALIFYNLYVISQIALPYDLVEATSFCLYVAGDIHQRILNHASKKLTTLELIHAVIREIKERNVPEEDEISARRFSELKKRSDFTILNSPDFVRLSNELDEGEWFEGNRTLTTIQYTPDQFECVKSMMFSLNLDEDFRQVVISLN